MKKVVTVNLGGTAYQLEEDGFAILAEYLENAGARLHGNPDVTEILLDLELAIAYKAELFLNARKNVVTTGEVEQIVEEMGPVDNFNEHVTEQSSPGDGSERDDAPGAASHSQKPWSRLYRLTGNEKMLAGVCAGLAERSGIDVSLVRIAFVALTLATSGLGVIGYFALALLMPSADTPLDATASRGGPFNVREVIDGARAKLDATRVARRRSPRESHRHPGHRGAYACASQYGRERHARGLCGFFGLGVLLFGLVISLYVLAQVAAWALRPFPVGIGDVYPFGTPHPLGPPVELLGVAILLVAAFVLWRFASARRRTMRSTVGSFAGFAAKLLVVLVVSWFALQLFAGDAHIFLHHPYYYVSNAWAW